MNEIVIRDSAILDGLGNPSFIGDVAINSGRISEVGNVSPGKLEINARGQTVSPGFIDTHSHDDGAFFRHPDMAFKMAQGVTTVVSGNCGFSAIPRDPNVDPGLASGGILAGLEGSYRDLEGYFAAALKEGPGVNNMMLVGHNTIRGLVMGMEKRAPTKNELIEMKAYVRSALEQGACGFSSGLIYRPGRWSNTDEVTELASVAGDVNALYTTHMRNEGDHLLSAVDEALSIGREANVHLHISHHKSAGAANWGKVGKSLAKVDQALAKGQPVTLDVYPYTAGSGRMIEYFDLNNINRELAEVIRIASCPAFRNYEGKMLKDIAADQSVDICDLTHNILTAPKGDRTICIHFIIHEQDIVTNLQYPDMMVGSDGIPDLKGLPHPRLFGTFPRILAKYVREERVLTLPEAVRRMTSLPAQIFGMKERGQIKEGYWADLVMFDPQTVQDGATYDRPKTQPTGISMVIINGAIAMQNGVQSEIRSGKMLRYKRSAFGE